MSNKKENCKKKLRIDINDPREYATVPETADFLRLCENKVRALIKQGWIKTEKVAIEIDGHLRRKTRIIRRSVKDFLEEMEKCDE